MSEIYETRPMRVRHPDAGIGKKVFIIVGGGFAGLNAAQRLSHSDDVAVVLIDQKNYHLFQPLLYVRSYRETSVSAENAELSH